MMKRVLVFVVCAVISAGLGAQTRVKPVGDSELLRFIADAPVIAEALTMLGMNFSGVEWGGNAETEFSPEPGWWIGLRANPASSRVLTAKSWGPRFWDIVRSLRLALYVSSLRLAYDQCGEESLKTEADVLSAQTNPEDLDLVERYRDRIATGLPFIDW